jgi:kynurenine formamidase
MRFVDLSAPIAADLPELPDVVRTEIDYADHRRGAQDIERMFGVAPELLRDGEGPRRLLRRARPHGSRPGRAADATRWLFEQGVRVMGIDAWVLD